MSIIRLVTNPEPLNPPLDRAVMYVSSETQHAMLKLDDGTVHYMSGITGIVSVDKIIDDGSSEAPGVGLPAELKGVRYIIRSNTSIGSINSGWGIIEGLQPNDIIQRNLTNTDWVIVKSAIDAEGNILVYNKDKKEVLSLSSNSWLPTNVERVIDVPITGILSHGKIHKVDNSSGPVSLTLPTAVGFEGSVINVKIITNSSNTVTISTILGQTIDGSGSQILSVGYSSLKVFSDGYNWYKI